MSRKHKIGIAAAICSLCVIASLVLVLPFESAHVYSNGLTLEENRLYAEVFRLESNQDLNAPQLTEPIVFSATPQTEEVILAFNYFGHMSVQLTAWEFGAAQERRESGRALSRSRNRALERFPRYEMPEHERAFDIGFTVEWVLEYPQSAVSFILEFSEDMLNRPTQTVGELTFLEYMQYVIYFDLVPDFYLEASDHSRPQYRDAHPTFTEFYLTGNSSSIAPTGMTHRILERLNYLLWEEPSRRHEQIEERHGYQILPETRNIAESFGFSMENPITVEWVLEYPDRALALAREMPHGVSDSIQRDGAVGWFAFASRSVNLNFMHGRPWNI